MHPAKIFADFQNTDAQGRLRLNCMGTQQDLARQQLDLREGLRLTLYDTDADRDGQPCELQAFGVASFSEDEQCWVATIDWTQLSRVPEASAANGGLPISRDTVPPQKVAR